MKIYSGENIRNVALVGHGHAGKTTLASAMLFTAGAAPRLGRVDDGSAVTDYDDEEIARKMSISVGAAVVEWGKSKINILDTPGFSMFVHEAKMALRQRNALVARQSPHDGDAHCLDRLDDKAAMALAADAIDDDAHDSQPFVISRAALDDRRR